MLEVLAPLPTNVAMSLLVDHDLQARKRGPLIMNFRFTTTIYFCIGLVRFIRMKVKTKAGQIEIYFINLHVGQTQR